MESAIISGQLKDWKNMLGIQGFERAFQYLTQVQITSVSIGRTLILGNQIYAVASQYQTKVDQILRFESHKQYIDIQVVISGQENIGFCPCGELEIIGGYNKENDVQFFVTPEHYEYIQMSAGKFAIFFPGQAHMPSCDLNGVHNVTKIVVKVSTEWFKKHKPS